MDYLIGRLAAGKGVDRTAAEKVVGIVLQFLCKEGPTERLQAPIQRMPGADAAMPVSSPSSRSPGMSGALMVVGAQTVAAGLSISKRQAVTRKTVSFARNHAGGDAVGDIVGAIPGLGRFV